MDVAAEGWAWFRANTGRLQKTFAPCAAALRPLLCSGSLSSSAALHPALGEPLCVPHCHALPPPPPRRSTVLPRMGWPPAAQEQLVFHITQSDPKQLKDFLKAALQQARSGASPGR